MKKIVLILLFLILTSFFLPSYVEAAKPRVRPSGKIVGRPIGFVSPMLRKDRLALILNLFNLKNYKNVSYVLTYNANGVSQGVSGSINGNQPNQSRELLFGTCSKNDCTYHKGISSMVLEVTATTKSGKTVVKKYRVKV